MTQEAVVIRLLPDGMAEVSVQRTTACGGNCGGCDSCVFDKKLKTPAKNNIGAQPGQRVLIESNSARIFGAAFLVYVLPLLFFLAGYLIAAALGMGESARILASFGAVLLCAAALVLSQRARSGRDEISFEIISFL